LWRDWEAMLFVFVVFLLTGEFKWIVCSFVRENFLTILQPLIMIMGLMRLKTASELRTALQRPFPDLRSGHPSRLTWLAIYPSLTHAVPDFTRPAYFRLATMFI
jgi:hypothetical protein